MIEIEMIINAIQYCSELAVFAISTKNKNINGMMKNLSSLSEFDIKKFYNDIENQNKKVIKKYMGYHETIISSKMEYEKYERSCDRFIKDIKKLSIFYNTYYQIYLSYKHGLRIIPIKNDNGEKLILEACKDNSMTIHKIPHMWYLEAIEVTEIINNIYEKLYIPLIRKKFSEFCGISFQDKKISKTINSTEPPDTTRNISLHTSFTFPWVIHDGKEPNPFY